MSNPKSISSGKTVVLRNQSVESVIASYKTGSWLRVSLIALQVVTLFVAFFAVDYNRYIVLDEEGRVIKLPALNQPNKSDPEVIEFAMRTISRAYTYGHKSFRQDLTLAQEGFTASSWDAFMSSLQSSGTLGMVQSDRMLVQGIVDHEAGNPQITKKSISSTNRLRYYIEFPMKVKFVPQEGSNILQNLQVLVVVERTPYSEEPRGISVIQLITEER